MKKQSTLQKSTLQHYPPNNKQQAKKYRQQISDIARKGKFDEVVVDDDVNVASQDI